MASIKKNFIYNLLYQILTIILPLITAPYISRVLKVEGIGIYSYTYSIASYFVLFAMLGITNHGNRSIAIVRDNKKQISTTFLSIYSFQLITFTIGLVLYGIYVSFILKDNRLIALIQALNILAGMFDISWFYFGIEKFKITVTRNIIIKIGTVITMFIFVRSEYDLWKYTLIMAMGTFISQIYLWAYINKYINFVRIKYLDVKKNIKPIFILFIPVIAYSIYKVMDKIMLGNISNYYQVGYYQNAEKIISIPMGIITALGVVMLPRMSNIIAKGNKEKTFYYINMSIKLVTILGGAIVFGLIGISNVFVPIYFGKGYEECIPLINILAISVFFIAWANVIRTQYLIPNKNDKEYIISTVIGALVNFILNIILIPKYYAVGAVIGSLVAEFTVMIVQMISVKRYINCFMFIYNNISILIFGIIMSVIVRVIGLSMGISIWTLIVQIFIGGVSYIGMLIIYFYIKKDEIFFYIKNKVNKK